MHQREDRSQGRENPENPTELNGVRFNGNEPENNAEKKKNEQSKPLKRAPGTWLNLRLFATTRADPFFLETERYEGNPENVDGVKRTNLYGTAGSLAGETIVVAKRNALLMEMIYAVDNEHTIGAILSIRN